MLGRVQIQVLLSEEGFDGLCSGFTFIVQEGLQLGHLSRTLYSAL